MAKYHLDYELNGAVTAKNGEFNRLSSLYLDLRSQVFSRDPVMQSSEADIALSSDGTLESWMWQLYRPDKKTYAKFDFYFAPHGDGKPRKHGFSPEDLKRMRIRVHNPTQEIRDGIERLVSLYED